MYLSGSHEVQIVYSKELEPSDILLRGIYGFLEPSETVAKAPREWQLFDIRLIRGMVTVVVKESTFICNQAISGISGGVINRDETVPEPVHLWSTGGLIYL